MLEGKDRQQPKHSKLKTILDLSKSPPDAWFPRSLRCFFYLVFITILTVIYTVHWAPVLTKLYEQHNLYLLLYLLVIAVIIAPTYYLFLAIAQIHKLQDSENKLKDENSKLDDALTKNLSTIMEVWNATLHQSYPDEKREIVVKSKTVPRTDSYVSMHQVDNNGRRYPILVATVNNYYPLSGKDKLIHLAVVAYSDLRYQEKKYKPSIDKNYVFYLSPTRDELRLDINISSYDEILDTVDIEANKSLNEYFNALSREEMKSLVREFQFRNPDFHSMSEAELKGKAFDLIKERMNTDGG